MLLRYFKSGLPSRFFVLFFVLFAFRLPGLIHFPPAAIQLQDDFLLRFFSLIPAPYAIHWILSFIILFFTGIYINYLGTRYGLTGKSSSMTLLFFVLLCGLLPFSDILNPYLIATFLLVWFFSIIFKIADTENPIRYAFDAGLILGTAALFYPVLLYLVVFIWVTLLVYQIAQWRTYFVALIGTATPYLFLYFIYFVWLNPITLTPDLIPSFKNLFTFLHWDPVHLMATIFFVFYIFYTAAQSVTLSRTKNIDVRQRTTVVFWGWIFILGLLIIFRSPPEAYLLLSIPSTWLLASFFESVKKAKRGSWFVFSLLIILLTHQFYLIFYAG